MKTLSPTISVLLLLLALAPLAAAEISVTTYSHEAEFNAAQQATRVCGCGTSTDTFTLTNRGDFDATFRLALETRADWIELPGTFLALSAGETIDVPVTLSPECGTEEVVDYKVYATSEFGRYRAADRTVEAHTCQPISIAIQPQEQTTLPCSPADFTVTVANPTGYVEDYTLTASENVELEEETFTLAGGQSRTIDGTTQWTCDVSGEQTIDIEAYAERTDVEEEAQATIIIKDDYDFALDAELHIETGTDVVCAQTTTALDLTVENTAETDNAYTIDVLGSFATLSERRLELAAGQEETVTIMLSPGERHAGEHTVEVIVQNDYGQRTESITVPLSVADCFAHRVSLTPQERTTCAGPANFTARITNDGLTAEYFSLESSGDIFSEPTRPSVWLRPNEHIDVTVQSLIPDRDDTFSVGLTATNDYGVSESTTSTVHAVSNAQCTRITPLTTELDVYTDATMVPLLVEHQGVKAATYTIGYDGTLFAPQQDEVFLAPGEQAVLHLLPQNLEGQEEGLYLETLTLTSDRAEYRYDLAVELDEKGFFTKSWERVFFATGGVDWCLFLMPVFVIAAIIALLMLLGVWTGAIKRPELTKDKRFAAIIVLVGAAIVLAVLSIAAASAVPDRYTEEPVGTNVSALFHEFPADETYRIDLGDYFADPDADTLTYSASQPEHVRVRLSGDIAELRAERDFSGKEYVVFTATDAQGLSADSPIMTLRVLQPIPRNFWGWLDAYCTSVNLALLALILLLLAGYFAVKTDKELEKRYGKKVRAALTPTPKEAAWPPRPAEPLPPMPERTGPQIEGDAVAGDKNIFVGTPKRETFVASKGGKKVHRAECTTAQRIPKASREVFTSREEALKEGYSPCKLCSPFSE